MKKDILTLLDLEKDDFDALLKRAFELKDRQKKGIVEKSLSGKVLGLVFEKPSTRTRVSFEAAMARMGGSSIFIAAKDSQMSRDESVKDTARALSGFLDVLAVRVYEHRTAEDFARWAHAPVINALTDLCHPCQVLSDLMTVAEYRGGYEDVKIVWLGDANNVAHSWINAASALDLRLTLACPREFLPDEKTLENARNKNGRRIEVVSDPLEAVQGADVIYTDVWTSMGQDRDEAKIQTLKPFQANRRLMEAAGADGREVLIMHCLPAHREEEITDDVMEGPGSVIWTQSENKMHMHMAVLETLI
ncbi:Ornithine carbamoyltransferase [Candidatus Desulfarcum epimagneticum]|uniref:Ornithine carbamoyltransferase n=1 Tax=uncultured Desulfobacteraceae bacterium TaxID=218296 RepID=A0A484HID5_9BACT|nr:Ornithine carbamoyltransferase [uncultured Desulfobacteraceae bacterium]